ncbi:MAG: host-nuclease inhibitor Gam family protein [Kiritimatiellaeota bacterium]|nr:host-nuclease inhibitor Gam family protein [Kiritimatiellota bacterium]
MTKKKSTSVQPITTREALESAMNDYAAKDATLRGIAADLDKEIAAVKERYAEKIATAEGALVPVAEAIEEWAALHPSEFEPKKSIELVGGRIGYRTTPPAVRMIKGVREETAIARILASQYRAIYARETPEIARDVILADYAAGTVKDSILEKLGLRIHRQETFFIDPDQTKTEANP